MDNNSIEEIDDINNNDIKDTNDSSSSLTTPPIQSGKIRKKKRRNKKRKLKLNEQIENENHYYNGELLVHSYYTLPQSVQKFWNRRFELFSKYNDGIYLSEELWYSVTPELIAKYIAQLFVKILPPEANCGLDVCCGGGGNTIQFARFFDSVGAIDINPVNLYCTEHNSKVYEVDDKIWTLSADWANITSLKENGESNYDWIPDHVKELRKTFPKDRTFDFIFSSPPWGGTNYDKNEFNLYEMEPFNIIHLLKTMTQYSNNVGLFLPKSSNLMQLSMATKEVYGDFKKCRAVYINSKGRSVALLALFGDIFTARFDELDDISEEALMGEDYNENIDENQDEHYNESGNYDGDEVYNEDENYMDNYEDEHFEGEAGEEDEDDIEINDDKSNLEDDANEAEVEEKSSKIANDEYR
ncbi:tgs1 [Candida jiufengensis]|uniref:tgs1 n=1 Tax=Candida jiufengensis TaxID=497108 RepID=UPI0022240A56|nr:tgs1 [Candida jiufengensis]KAI5953660.1 tgs1 [Candida jiufengensis]